MEGIKQKEEIEEEKTFIEFKSIVPMQRRKTMTQLNQDKQITMQLKSQ